MAAQEKRYKSTVYIISLIGALGGLLFGLDQGFIANSLSTIDRVYQLTLAQGQFYTAVLSAGAILGTLLSGFFIRVLGRKKVIVIAGFLFTLFSLISAFLPSLNVLIACRFGLGFAVGVATLTVPLYLAETAPTAIRGSMTTLFQLMITIGIFIISLANVSIIKFFFHSHISLTLMFTTIVIFALLMFIGALFLPESPRWMILRGKKAGAIKILRQTLNTEAEVEEEVKEIERSIHQAKGAGFSMLTKKFFWKVLIVGVIIQMFQQLVGINAMIYYAPTIFGYAKMTGIVALLAVPVVNMLCTFPALRWVEKWGRKKLLYFGAVVMALSLIAVGIAFGFVVPNQVPSIATKVVLLVGVLVFIFGFACSWGPVAWVLCTEIFPLKGREIGITITTMVNWSFVFVVAKFSLTVMHTWGQSSLFFIFAAFCLLSIVFLRFFVPETKGVMLEKIERNLENGVKLNKIGSA